MNSIRKAAEWGQIVGPVACIKEGPMKKRRINSRRKGAEGERELADVLYRIFGWICRRGQQFSGVEGRDIVGALKGLHIECKRVENLRLRDSLEQAERDAADGDVPCVMYRSSRQRWTFICLLEDLPRAVEVLSQPSGADAEESGGSSDGSS